LLVAKILKGFTKIKGLLPCLACGNEFGFGSRQRLGYVVLIQEIGPQFIMRM